MARTIRWFSGWVSALLIIGTLAFGISTAFAAMPVCGDDPGEIGTCPPYTNATCDAQCWILYPEGGGGMCYQGGTCCLCAI